MYMYIIHVLYFKIYIYIAIHSVSDQQVKKKIQTLTILTDIINKYDNIAYSTKYDYIFVKILLYAYIPK